MTYDDGDYLFRAALSRVLREGRLSAPRGKLVMALTSPTTLTLEHPDQPFVTSLARRANYRFGVSEACWIMAGRDDVMTVARHNARMREFSDDGLTLWGAYGPRIAEQLSHVIDTLKRDVDSRQAVITTWRPMSGPPYTIGGQPQWDGSSWRSKDVPCTVAWHFQIFDGCLDLTVFMRSNDAWLGLPYDVLSFTTVQRVVASMLGVMAGRYNHVVSNLHLYNEHIDLARAVLESDELPPLPPLPPLELLNWMPDGVHDRFSRVLTKPNFIMTDPCMTLFQSIIHRQADPFRWPGLQSLQVR